MNEPRMKTTDAGLERARHMLERARWAAAEFRKIDRDTVSRIVRAAADAGFARSRAFAEAAVAETGYGVVAHKTQKNEACSRGLVELYDGEDFVSPRIDAARKMVELPRPAGVVLALVPVTNPVATVYFKTLLALMTRNAVIVSPHPGAKRVCAEAARVLAEAAEAAGAPAGVVQVMEEPTIPLVEAVMQDRRVDLIVATGGPAVVGAAYRSGNPALGVGPGNAPVLVDDTADLKAAAERIVASKSFDNSILCTNESTVLAFEGIADDLLRALQAAGAHVCSEEETSKVRALLFREDGFNTDIIGKDAAVIAERAGFRAPRAKILVTPVGLVQPEEKLVREKLCPVLAFARVGGTDQAISAARSMMRSAGRGHSAAVHTTSERRALAFSAAVPALRIAINAGCSLGAAGFETHLGPSMTIGTGFAGGSSISDNLTPHHLIQTARMAYNKDASVPFGQYEGLDPLALEDEEPMRPTTLRPRDDLRDELRRIIREELDAVLAA